MKKRFRQGRAQLRLRNAIQAAMQFEPLEERRLLSYSLSTSLNAYNTAAADLAGVNQATQLVNQALGTNIPMLGGALSSVLQLAGDFQAPFGSVLSSSNWGTLGSDLQSELPAGFTVNATSPDGNPIASGPYAGDLLEISYTQSFSAPQAFSASGQTGFSDLDNFDSATGGLIGEFTLSAPSITLTLNMGVDVPTGQNTPQFFIAAGTGATGSSLTVSNFSASGSLGGTLDLGQLGSVSATATANATLTQASLSFIDPNLATDGGANKVRIGDIQNNLSSAVTGTVAGTASISANLTASISLISTFSFSWQPTFSAAIGPHGLVPGSIVQNLNPPTASSILSDLGNGFLGIGRDLISGGGGSSLLGPLSDLTEPLPLIGQSIAQLTGLDNDLPSFPDLSALNPSDVIQSLYSAGFKIDDQPTAADLTPSVLLSMVTNLVEGNYVDLISWSDSGSVSLLDSSITVPIYSLGVKDVASLDINASFGIYASLNYHIGLGIDTNGFYIDSGPLLGLTFGVTAGISGDLEVFSFPLATAGGDIGFSITPSVSLTAPSWDTNGRVYAKDLAIFGSNPFTDFVDALGVNLKGDITGDLYANIDLVFWSISWHWGVDVPVFDLQTESNWPAVNPNALLTGSAAPPTAWPNLDVNGQTAMPGANLGGGTLVFNDPSATDNAQVHITEGANNSVTVDWIGQGTETFQHVGLFQFFGAGGNDQLTTAPNFTIPIQATSGDHENGTQGTLLEGGDGANTLQGGGGYDTLIGGAGNDTIKGYVGPNAGNTLIIGNNGNDTLTAGSAPTEIIGGTGNSTLYGGSGNDTLNAGGGNDVIYGGSGVYNISGGSGNNLINLQNSSGTANIHAGSGHDTIYGGTSPDLIYGDSGSDTIYGGSGQDTIYGGSAGNNYILGSTASTAIGNVIYGGGSGDTIAGGNGNNTIYGGPGNETLYGGDGLQLVSNSLGNGLNRPAGDNNATGSNFIVAGAGNDLIYGDSTGHNTLTAAAGNDTLYAGTGGDYLAAGGGIDAIYGGPGNDTIEENFFATSTTPDTIVGGLGYNTLVLKPTTSGSQPGPGYLTQSIPASQAQTSGQSIYVSNAAVITQAEINAGYVIQIDNEQMLVTANDETTLSGTVTASQLNTANASEGIVTPQSETVTGLASTSGLYVGELVTGAGIPGGTTITAITSGTSITLSNAAIPTPTTVPLTFATQLSGTTTAQQPNVTGLSSTSTLYVGDLVSGAGIPVGTTIAAINASGNAITLSANATASAGSVPLTFDTQDITAQLIGTTTAQSPVITGLSSTSALLVGESVEGAGIPAGAVIAAINSNGSSITLSTNATATGLATPITFALQLTGTSTALSPTITGLASTSGLYVGEPVSGAGIPQGATVAAILPGGTSINISSGATAVASVVPLVFASNAVVTGLSSTSGLYIGESVSSSIQLNGSSTAMSPLLTGLSSTSGLYVGDIVSGIGIPVDTTITSIQSGSAVMLSANVTASSNQSLFTFSVMPGATIAAIPSGNSITLSIGSNVTASVVPITFSGMLTVTRGYNLVAGTSVPTHSAVNSSTGNYTVVQCKNSDAGPASYYLYFNNYTQPGEYQATLYNLGSGNTEGAQIGQVDFTIPSDIEQVALEGGLGNNVINVDPSVTAPLFLYGGPGNNTLLAGSGSDTLVGGPGTSLLEGGAGNDDLYGDDAPGQDASILDSDGTQALQNPVYGHNTLIAGTGNDNLYAGNGGDILIGGSAELQGNTWVLVPGAGRDVFTGGTGQDLMIAGSGSAGAIMFGGSNNDIMIGDNTGQDIFEGGSAPTATANLSIGSDIIHLLTGASRLITVGESIGQVVGESWISAGTVITAISGTPNASGYYNATAGTTITISSSIALPVGPSNASTGTNATLVFGGNLMLGGNLSNVFTGGTGNDTLVGGIGNNDLQAGGSGSSPGPGGNQIMSGIQLPSYWVAAQSFASTLGVSFTPPSNPYGIIVGNVNGNVVSNLLTTDGLFIGESISGGTLNTSSPTTIASIVSATQITLSQSALTNGTGETLTVGNPLAGYNQLLNEQASLQPIYQPLENLAHNPYLPANTVAGSNIVSIAAATQLTGITTQANTNAIDTFSANISAIEPGELITGPGIPLGTIVTQVIQVSSSQTQGDLILSNDVAAPANGATFYFSTQLTVGQNVSSGSVFPALSSSGNPVVPTIIGINLPAMSSTGTFIPESVILSVAALTTNSSSTIPLEIGLTTAQQIELQSTANDLVIIGLEEITFMGYGSGHANVIANFLVGGTGNDQLYSGTTATQMVAGTGVTYFNDYNANDTLSAGGGSGGNNGTGVLVFQGDGAINVQYYNASGVTQVTLPGQNGGNPYIIGSSQTQISPTSFQYLEIEMSSGANDSVSVNAASTTAVGLTTGIKGIIINDGSGSDTINVEGLSLMSTLVGGSGADEYLVSNPTYPSINLGSGTSTLGITIGAGAQTVNVSGGVISWGTFSLNGFPGYQSVSMLGGTGPDTFNTDGTLPTVVFVGGSGTNTFNDNSGGIAKFNGGTSAINIFNVSAGAVTINGGSAADNQYNINGAGNYTINGGASSPSQQNGQVNSSPAVQPQIQPDTSPTTGLNYWNPYSQYSGSQNPNGVWTYAASTSTGILNALTLDWGTLYGNPAWVVGASSVPSVYELSNTPGYVDFWPGGNSGYVSAELIFTAPYTGTYEFANGYMTSFGSATTNMFFDVGGSQVEEWQLTGVAYQNYVSSASFDITESVTAGTLMGFALDNQNGANTSDQTGLSFNVTLNYSVPTAAAYSYTVVDGLSVQGNMLSNDSALSVNPLTCQALTQPSHGTLSWSPNGSFTYTPTRGWYGTDSFTYESVNGQYSSPPATVTITVNAPTIVAPNYSASTSTGKNVSGNIVTGAGLIGSGASSASTNTGDALTAVALSNPSHGTLSFQSSGQFLYTPNPGYGDANDSFMYEVSDMGFTSTATVTISVSPPTIVAPNYSISTPAWHQITGNVLSSATTSSGETLTAALVSNPSYGTVTLNTSTGVFTYTPNPGNTSLADSFQYEAIDSSFSSTGTVTITIGAPVVTANPYSFPTTEGHSYSGNLASIAQTSSGIPLTFSSSQNPYNGSLSLSTSGPYTYVPSIGFLGNDSFKYTAADPPISAGNTVTITVNPVTVVVSTPTAGWNQPVTIPYFLTDLNSGTYSVLAQYSVNGGPWLNATPASGSSGTADGTNPDQRDGLAATKTGTADQFVWNDQTDLGSTNDPSVVLRISTAGSTGTGPAGQTIPFAVDNTGVINQLNIRLTDGSNHTITLGQSGSTINIGGSVTVTAQNLTGVSVTTGAGVNNINASNMIMAVTLDGGTGSGADSLYGGAGSDTLYVSGQNSVYNGGGGGNNVVVDRAGSYAAQPSSNSFVNSSGGVATLGSTSNIDQFAISQSQESSNGQITSYATRPGLQSVWPTAVQAVSLNTPVFTQSGAATLVTATFADSNSTASTDSVTVNWGDGSTSTATVTSNGNGTYTATSSHLYSQNSTYTATVTVVDPGGTSSANQASFTGGLQLSGGTLYNYNGSAATQVATGVQSYVARNSDQTLFVLNTSGGLYVAGGNGRAILTQVSSFGLGFENNIYALTSVGNMYEIDNGSTSTILDNTGVKALLKDSAGTLFELNPSNQLDVNSAASGTWAYVVSNVQSIALTSDQSAINVMETSGNYYRFDGTNWTFISGPTLTVTPNVSSPTAGGAVSVTVNAVNALGGLATGFADTVQFGSSDINAGLPGNFTFNLSNGGTGTFSVTLKTTGVESISVTDVSNASLGTASANVTVVPAALAALSVTVPPASVTAGSSAAVDVSALDQYGNVITNYSGTATLVFPAADSTLQITGSDEDSTGYWLTPQGADFLVGQPVVYEANGSSVAGLTNSTTYYIAENPANQAQIGLASSYANALAATVLNLGTITINSQNPALTGESLGYAYTTGTDTMLVNFDNGVHAFTGVFDTAGYVNVSASVSAGSPAGKGIGPYISPTTVSGSVNLVNGAGVFNASTSTVTVTPGTVLKNTSSPVVITLTANDSFGNQLQTGGLSVGITLFAGTGSFSGGVVDNGNGTYSRSFVPSASYTGTDFFEIVVNQTLVAVSSLQVAGSTTASVGLTASAGSPVASQPVTFTATVMPAIAGITPTGTVTFDDNGSAITGAAPVALVNGVASFTDYNLSVGSNSITAVYSGDGNFSTATSAANVQSVSQDASGVTVTTSSNPQTYGQGFTLKAVVSAAGPGTGTPAGSVTFMNGSQVLGTANFNGGTATLAVSSLPAATYNITAIYGGSSNYQASTSAVLGQVITQATPILTVTDINGNYSGSPFTATALLNGAASLEGVTPALTYYPGVTASGTPLSGAPTTIGTYTVVASFNGSADYTTVASSPFTFTIGNGSLSVTVSDAGGTYNGSRFAATALVNGAASLESIIPSITYFAGTSAGGTALSGAPSAAGTYTAVATFAGSSDFASANSSATTFIITRAAPTVTVTDPGGTFSGGAFPGTATVAGVVPGVDTTPASSLEGISPALTYYVGSFAGGTTLSGAPTAVGTYTVVSSFAGSADYASANSSSVTFSITSLAQSSSYYLRLDADGQHIDIWNSATDTGSYSEQLIKSQAGGLGLTASGGTGTFTIDNSNGSVLPTGGMSFAGDGNTALLVIGSGSGDTVSLNAGQFVYDGTNFSFSGVTTTTLNPYGGTDTLSINAGQLILAASPAGTGLAVHRFSSITIAGGTELQVATPASRGDRALIVTSALSIAGSSNHWTGQLDLGGNDLDVPGGVLSTITNQLAQGYSGGNWTGLGIDSSAAATDTSRLSALGVIQNNQNGIALYGSSAGQALFDGVAPGASDVLVKLTYYGDTNLDGKVDGSDYSRIDSAAITHATGWFNGDFNYEGTVNGSDYTLIDNAFNTQGGNEGTTTAVSYYLKMDPDGLHIDIWNNTTGTGSIARQVLRSQGTLLTLSASGGAGMFTVDNSSGDVYVTGGLTLAGDGSTALMIIGSGNGDTITAGAGQITFDGSAISFSGVTTETLDPRSGTDALAVNAGDMMIVAAPAGGGILTRSFSSIVVGAGAEVQVLTAASHSDRALIVVGSMTVAGSAGHWTGLLDLGGNDLDLQSGSLAALSSLAAAGYNYAGAANWQAEGLSSSIALADTTHLTTLGVIQNNQGGSAIYGSGAGQSLFDATAPGGSDILVKFTYVGDANLDGKVDGSDYNRLDNGVLNHLTGWFNGDFNYAGVVNGSDYALIDNAYNTQRASLTAEIAVPMNGAVSVKAKPVVEANAILPPSRKPQLPANRPNPFSAGTPVAFEPFADQSAVELRKKKGLIDDMEIES